MMGRHKSLKKIAEEQLQDALYKVGKEKQKPFLEHFVRRAYASDTVAVALAKKIVSDKQENENTGETDIYNIINQIRGCVPANNHPSVELDTGNGMDEGRTRFNESGKEVSE